MSSSPLRVGVPALPGGSLPPIEGARLALDGPTLSLFVVFEEPTAAEIAAVDSAPVDIGVYHEEGLAALVVRIGEPHAPGLIETYAPLVLPERAPHLDEVGAAEGDSLDSYPAEIALCEAAHTVVCALRRLAVPADLHHAARRAAQAQAVRFESVAVAIRAHERGLRSHTVQDLLYRSVVRAHISARPNPAPRIPPQLPGEE